jgi:hypothetical protein
MATTTPRPRVSPTTRAALADVLSHLEALADTRPDDDPDKIACYQRHWRGVPHGMGVTVTDGLPVHACAIAPEHREAVQSYLESWVIWPLRAVAEQLNGTADWATDAYVRQVADSR